LLCALLVLAACDDEDGPPGPPAAGPSAVNTAAGGGTLASGTAGPDATAAAAGTQPAGRTPEATAPPPIIGDTVLSIDADATSPAVNVSAAYGSGAEFDVVVTLDVLTESAAGYQIDLTWDPAVLAFVEIENNATQAFPACSRTLTTANSVSMACLHTQDDSLYTGPLASVTFRCAAAGETTLALRLPGNEVIGTRIESRPGRNIEHDLTLNEATVTCA
jgi:hypothetical protein